MHELVSAVGFLGTAHPISICPAIEDGPAP